MKKMFLLTISIFISVSFSDEFVEATTTIGGYGELHWDMEGEAMDFHRFIVFINHNFDDRWAMKSEVELEHNMAGASEGGYIALEQAYITYMANNWDFKGGVILAPVGIINETHEPPTFLSVERPDYAKYIVPTTWFGNGLQFNYNLDDFRFGVTMMEDIVGGYLSNDGSEWDGGAAADGKYAFRSGRGKGDDSHATDLTKVLGFSWIGMEGLKVAGSMTMNNMPIFWDSDGEENWELIDETIGLSLIEFNVQYNNHNFVVVLESGSGKFDMDEWNNSVYAATDAYCNNENYDNEAECVANMGNNSAWNPFEPGTAAKAFEGMRLDLGYNIGSLLGDDCDLTLWTRMTSWDSNSKLNDSESVGEVSKSLFGVTWKPKNNISFKMTMGTKDIEWTDSNGAQSSSSDVMNLGIGYMF